VIRVAFLVFSCSLKGVHYFWPQSKPAGEAVKKALLVGNFEAAVECCFRTGNLADALILASCGGAELWERTQERYFQSEEKKRPFLSLVNAIIQNKVNIVSRVQITCV
jgi:protein transport protein SEC31